MTRRSQNTIRVVAISAELQAIRRAILRYNFDHDEPSYAEAEKRLTDTSDLLDLTLKETRSEEWLFAYMEIQKEIAELKLKRVALGDAVKRLVAGRDLMFADGDKMAADVQKFVEAAEKANFSQAANALESKVLLVRVANWRMLATRDFKVIRTVKADAGDSRRQIYEILNNDLPHNLTTFL